MGFYTISQQMLNTAFTTNGDKAYTTTGSACLDYFALIGGKRGYYDDALNLFMKAYYENPQLAIKILFYARDIRTGLGERNIFRYTLNAIAGMYPELAVQLIEYVPVYGRYDDLLVLLNTPVKEELMKYISNVLNEDLEKLANNEPISLLAKWLPSINTSSHQTRKLAMLIIKSLGITCKEYRGMLASLRKGMIIENNLRERDYSFSYEKVSGNALLKYSKAFLRHDNERYKQYLSLVSFNKAKMNSSTIYPYEIIRKLKNSKDKNERDNLNVIWNSFDRTCITSKTIVVRDGSGSMEWGGTHVEPIDIATSLAILFSEQLTGEFKNKFITFSSKPQIIDIVGNTIYEKYKFISKFDDCSNTDIAKVYKLILNIYRSPEFNEEDALDRIVIISDMQFDKMQNESISTFEYFEQKFNEFGFKLPEIVFWNVSAPNNVLPTINKTGVKLISGSSSNVIDMVINNASFDAYDFMNQCLEKYNFVDNLNFNLEGGVAYY